MYGFYWDTTYILVLIGMGLCALASGYLRSTFSKYDQIRSATGLTGAQVAARILQANGIHDVTVRAVSGSLTDHYDPVSRTVNLSQSVYGKTSLAALGVAAHECGHVLQHHEGYLPLNLRTAILPVANIGSRACWILILIGVFLGSSGNFLIQIGILCFVAVVAFQLVTLPVEYNASSRALDQLEYLAILSRNETDDTRKVLNAAALTYVAGTLSAVLQLLRLILLFGGRRDRS